MVVEADVAEREALVACFRMMTRIRLFEEKLETLRPLGKIPGAAHLYIGEEAVAVGTCSVLRSGDRVTSTHRGHGHVIAKGADLDKMMAELFGKSTGYCKGKGGSMHICDVPLGILGANGIVGGGIAIAVGSALSDQVLGRDNVTVSMFGDGAANQGVLMESLNLSAIWRLPVIFVCENNQYNEWMRSEQTTAGRICDRGLAFGVPGVRVDGNDVRAMRAAVDQAVTRARGGEGPTLIEAMTYRHRGHEDGEEAFGAPKRPDDEVRRWMDKDPIASARAYLASAFGVGAEAFQAVIDEEQARVDGAVTFAEQSPFPDPSEVMDDLFAPSAA
jgi:acetoin:2,6-dichlorophenolindophenol oxidoreductase subunit alpha